MEVNSRKRTRATGRGPGMRIGVDACCWSNQRGFGRFTRELLRSLVAFDSLNEYVFFSDSHSAGSNDFPETVQRVAVPTAQRPTEAASAAGRRSVQDLWAFSREVARHDLDLFFFPAVYSYYPILNRSKIVVTVHDMIADHFPKLAFPNWKLKLFWKLKQNLAVRQADLILTVSEYSRQQIAKYFKLPDSRLRAITEAAQPAFRLLPSNGTRTTVLSRYQLQPPQKFLLYVGGISPHKNLKVLFEAFHQLSTNPAFADVKLVLVGDYENDAFYSDYPALKLRSKQLGLEGKIVFTGFVEDEELAHLYNSATVVVLPSLEEGFGLPAIEAMACGAPVACSDRGSFPEILGDAGSFFDPLWPKTIVRVLEDLLSSDALRRQMRQRGLRRVEKFTWEAAARETAAIFCELAGSPCITNS